VEGDSTVTAQNLQPTAVDLGPSRWTLCVLLRQADAVPVLTKRQRQRFPQTSQGSLPACSFAPFSLLMLFFVRKKACPR
jgi:hypothetical protein